MLIELLDLLFKFFVLQIILLLCAVFSCIVELHTITMVILTIILLSVVIPVTWILQELAHQRSKFPQ